jgi:protein NRD1
MTCRQTNANTGLVGAGLDAAQLALLQQLALAQTASSAAPPAPSQLAPRAVSAPSGSAVPLPSTYRDKPLNASLNDGGREWRHSPERVNGYDDQRDDREASFRGARAVRGRGGRSRWDDRDRDRYKGKDAYKGRRSRSRSPPSRYGGRWDKRPYSPPRRPSLASMSPGSQQGKPDPTRDTGKDEFGRDIRPKSPGNDLSPVPNIESTQLSLSIPVDDPIPDLPSAVASNHERMSLVAANTSSSITSASIVPNEVSSAQLGMENFDSKTFDPTSPESWQVLGKMWQVTYGCMPSTEQLMQFVITAAAGQASVSGESGINQDWSTPSADGWRGGGYGRGGYSGSRGNFGRHGNARDGKHWTHDSTQTTDAVVLGEATEPEAGATGKDESQINSGSPIRSIGSGGRMQRMGDKWLFVRDSAEVT